VTELRNVPFNRAYTTGSELGYIREAIESTRIGGNGPFARRCGKWLEERTTAKRALLTHSATGALEMAVLLTGIEPGDEVIMPSFTFVSTANAVVLRGGSPVFIDVRPDTLNIDELQIEDAITERTKAIVAVHYAGIACAMDEVRAIADRYGLLIIEDAAQAILSFHRGRPLGSLGHAAALSFHETKNVMCGEGGALLVNEEAWIQAAEIVHEKGTDRGRFFRGEVDKYTWVDRGSSFVLSDLNAAFLWAQLEAAEEITAMRIASWNAYHEALGPLEEDGWLRRPVVPPYATHNAHIYYVILDAAVDRGAFLRELAARRVNAVFHYVPLHSSPGGRRWGRVSGPLSITDELGDRLVRLPLWAGMTDADVEAVVNATGQAASRARPRAAF
jgi:dTDP-4-amino-4,6-dideoxygalactose transaminase